MSKPSPDGLAMPAHTPEACKAEHFLTIGEGTPTDFIEQLDAYLARFARPIHNEEGEPVCLNCGGVFNGFKSLFGLSVSVEWGITHGEARCTGCGWPMRGMHYPKDADGNELLTMRNVFLAYMPEFVERVEPALATGGLST